MLLRCVVIIPKNDFRVRSFLYQRFVEIFYFIKSNTQMFFFHNAGLRGMWYNIIELDLLRERELIIMFVITYRSSCYLWFFIFCVPDVKVLGRLYPRLKRKRKKKFPCPRENCVSSYTEQKNLARHLKYECGQDPRFQCPYCKYCSKQTSTIFQHIRRWHTTAKVFAMDIMLGTCVGKYAFSL